jgi:SAM-dependent methyltransferase
MLDKQPLSYRTSFDQTALAYDAVRPGYPPALIEDIVTTTGLPSPARILEIGCGTGQATLPFAERGDRLTCLDIGAEMLAVARPKFATFPNVEFQHTSFEDWSASPNTFDLVMSATAFHWVAPEVGYSKAAQLLKPGGLLAIFSNEHPAEFSGFFADIQSVYARIIPELWIDPRDGPPIESGMASVVRTIDSTGLFEPAIARSYPWREQYTTSQYLRLIGTYSPNLALPAEKRKELFEGIAEFIDTQYGGKISKLYLAVLYLARKPV